MSESACRACRGEWPATEAFIADCGPTRAYLHEDQFFAGWTVLVLTRHVTELYELDRQERGALMDAVSEVARALAAEPRSLDTGERRTRTQAVRARLAP